MKRCLISFLLAFIVLQLKAQLSLDSCLYLAKTYFPAIQQIAIYDKILSEQLSNVNRNWIPAIQGTAQATYQSDVTSLNLNLPGFPAITPPPKDQYKFFIDASQLIYDGGSNVSQKNILRSINSAEKLKIESEYQKTIENVIHLYFGILILKEQKKILEFTQSDVSNNLKKSKIAYDAKAISGYHLNVMNAESIKLDQKITETNSQMKTSLLNLGKIIHRDLSENDIFSVPLQIPVNQSINRPEYKLILVQRALLQQQNKLNSSRAIPKVLAFGQAGYSNPALNFLKDEFQTYYIAGLKLNWNISSLYNLKSDNRISKLNGSITELQEEAFLYKLNLEKTQMEVDADKFLILQGQDKQLVFLLSKIKEASKLQYENGSLTLSEYLKDLNAEEQARLNEVIHRISYLKSLYLNNNLYGNQQ